MQRIFMKYRPSEDGYTYIGAPDCVNPGDDEDFIEYIKTSLEPKKVIGFLDKGLKIRHHDSSGKATGQITMLDDPEFIQQHNDWLRAQEEATENMPKE